MLISFTRIYEEKAFYSFKITTHLRDTMTFAKMDLLQLGIDCGLKLGLVYFTLKD